MYAYIRFGKIYYFWYAFIIFGMHLLFIVYLSSSSTYYSEDHFKNWVIMNLKTKSSKCIQLGVLFIYYRDLKNVFLEQTCFLNIFVIFYFEIKKHFWATLHMTYAADICQKYMSIQFCRLSTVSYPRTFPYICTEQNSISISR